MEHPVTARDRAWLLAEKYAGKETPQFFADVERLASGEPLAYVIGHVPFIDVTVDLSCHPLIPRVETEYWVERVLQSLKEERAPRHVLDIFSGSGCIGIALARTFPEANVDFAENDAGFLAQIKKNITLNRIDASRTHVIKSDVFSHISGTYDHIFANPPYIPKAHEATLPDSVKKFEPYQALFADDNGLFFIQKLISEAPKFLTPGGSLFIEFDSEQKDTLEAIVTQDPSWQSVEFMKDQYDVWRMATLIRPH